MGTPKRRKTELEKIDWGSVAIPKKMLEQVRKILPKIYGYASVADYCRDAIRRKLQLDEARIDMEKKEEEY